eukprot:s793_g11.t1
MDLRGSNSVLRILEGDIRTLGGAAGFTTVSLEKNQVISISGDDLVSSFYLFRMPDAWKPFLSFERAVSWRALGVERDGETFLSSAVLPMGFSSSVGIMQHLHRRLALWDPRAGAGLTHQLEIRKDREFPELTDETPAWALYLDDSTFLRRLGEAVDREVAGKPGAEQERLRRAYQHWGVPYNVKKAIEEVECTERLGAFLDGRRGRIGVTVQRTLECLSLGHWVLSQGRVSRKALQIFAGKEVHCLQFRRPLFSVYDSIWSLISGEDDYPFLTKKVCEEIMVSLSLCPLRFTDWRAEVDPHVMASDASETGGGFVMAKRLTKLGEATVARGDTRESTRRNGVVVVDFFAGIGGLLRSLERAGLEWEHHVVCESDKRCRKCIRRTWPGGSEYADITKITKADLARELDKVEKLTLVVGGGGSPCQGLSRLSSERQHLQDERSKLFYDLADRLEDLEALCKERGAKFVGMVENVVMDEKDRDEITLRLCWTPHLCESGDISRVRRPRFYWLSDELPEAPWFKIFRGDVATKVTMVGELEPDGLWLLPDFSWSGSNTNIRFPTFTRPIKRRRPPPSPAGLEQSSADARRRWEGDQFRFPPYTYEERYLIQDKDGNFYKLPAVSREILMGYPKGHTRRMDRELFMKTDEVEAEDARQSAIGNSFHTSTVAALLGTILHAKGVLAEARGPDVLLQRLLIEDADRQALEYVEGQSDSAAPTEVSLTAQEELEQLALLEERQDDLNEEVEHKMLMSRLVSLFLRKVEIRGSDIRLDSDVLFRPSACPRSSISPDKWEWKHCRAFKWAKVAHINLLELKALIHAVQWRARRQRYHSFRTMILIDNQSIVAVVTKGRSSSKQVNHLLRRLCSLCLALNLYLLIGWIDTVDNPADEASRLHDAVGKD